MSKIQSKLESLQPYVVGIRYVEGIPFIDVVFKEGWNVPKSSIIKRHINEENTNHYIFFTEKEGIGVDELLDFAEKIINLNIEREKKHELLKVKVKELQKIFIDNSLTKLKTIKFGFGQEQLIPDVMVSEDIMSELVPEPVIQEVVNEPMNPKPGTVERHTPQPTRETGYVDKDGTPILEEVQAPIEVEDITSNVQQPQKTHNLNGSQQVELPPKNGKIELEEHGLPPEMTQGTCNCGPNEACPKCMDEKGY